MLNWERHYKGQLGRTIDTALRQPFEMLSELQSPKPGFAVVAYPSNSTDADTQDEFWAEQRGSEAGSVGSAEAQSKKPRPQPLAVDPLINISPAPALAAPSAAPLESEASWESWSRPAKPRPPRTAWALWNQRSQNGSRSRSRNNKPNESSMKKPRL